MNHLERSQEIVPLASIRAMPRSVSTITQELKRYGEPRQETHCWLTTNSTQQIRTRSYNRDRSSQTQKRRTDKADTSVYEILIMKSKSMSFSFSILYQPFINNSSLQKAINTCIGCIDRQHTQRQEIQMHKNVRTSLDCKEIIDNILFQSLLKRVILNWP